VSNLKQKNATAKVPKQKINPRAVCLAFAEPWLFLIRDSSFWSENASS
jgi:hypothetical protein